MLQPFEDFFSPIGRRGPTVCSRQRIMFFLAIAKGADLSHERK